MGALVPRHRELTNVNAALDGRDSVAKVRILLFCILGVLNLHMMLMKVKECKNSNS